MLLTNGERYFDESVSSISFLIVSTFSLKTGSSTTSRISLGTIISSGLLRSIVFVLSSTIISLVNSVLFTSKSSSTAACLFFESITAITSPTFITSLT